MKEIKQEIKTKSEEEIKPSQKNIGQKPKEVNEIKPEIKTKSEDKQISSDKNIEKKKEKIKEVKNQRNEIVVRGLSLKISTKQSIAICNMIRNRSIPKAMQMLEEVLVYRRVVKMNNREVGHKKGKGVMAGRYPQNAVKEFIRLVKQLEANANNHGFEIPKAVIWCKADQASRPYRGGGTRFKRTHVTLKLIKRPKKK